MEGTYDVAVAGFGYAGAMSAIAAARRGARVAIFEKSDTPGGTSILASGSAVAGREYGPTLAYLGATCGDATPAELLDVMARGMIDLPRRLALLAAGHGLTTREIACRAYPLPGGDQLTMVHISRSSPDAPNPFPWTTGVSAGATLFHVLYEEVRRHPEIDVFLSTPVRDLRTGPQGEVCGVRVETGGGLRDVAVRGGTVLCTGGFENDPELLSTAVQLESHISIAHPGNTGDGVRMAERLGAKLWHMWHLHGSYGFRVPGVPIGVRHAFGGWRDDQKVMPWIAVDRDGLRFMNEYPFAPADTPIRELLRYETERQRYPRVPCYLIFDDAGRAMGPVGSPRFGDPNVTYAWSDDNRKEVAAGIIAQAETVEELAGRLGLPPVQLAAQVERWNLHVAKGCDEEFGRPAGTMLPITRPPFFGIPAWPAIGNTQGGPAHDTRQRVLHVDGAPIPRLYVAGELGAIWGKLYLLGGNISECLIGGEIAGDAAAQEALGSD